MGISASELRCNVICRTRTFLARQTPATDYFLLGIAASQSALKAELGTRFGDGLYSACAELPRTFRNGYLAKHPDFASQFRELANPHAFLPVPDSELRATLGYCTAIARLKVEARRVSLPGQDDLLETARIWRRIFQPHGRLQGFTLAWQTWVRPLYQAEPAIS